MTFSSSMPSPAKPVGIDRADVLGLYARCFRLAIANGCLLALRPFAAPEALWTDANGQCPRALFTATDAVGTGLDRLSRDSPGRDLRTAATGRGLRRKRPERIRARQAPARPHLQRRDRGHGPHRPHRRRASLGLWILGPRAKLTSRND